MIVWCGTSFNNCLIHISIIILKHKYEKRDGRHVAVWMSSSVMASDPWPCCPTCFFAGGPASWPPRGPSVARGVERTARKQSLWHKKPVTRVDLCPVGEGPMGAVCIQPPPTGQPAQTLPHSSQLRLALRLYSNADAHAPGRHKVSVLENATLLFSVHPDLTFLFLSIATWYQFPIAYDKLLLEITC